VEELEWRQVLSRATRPAVEHERGGCESLGPKDGRHGGVREQGAHGFVQSPEHALRAAVLGGCVGAGHAQGNAMAVKKFSGSLIVELAAVIGLQSEHRQIEVSGSYGMETFDCREGIRFEPKRECPCKVAVIIQ
jgi:hypothetical protein